MKINIKDILAYVTGNFRHSLYYTKLNFLIPKHIRKQIEIRLNSMNPKCYSEGACLKCGCVTPALQMANKPCEGMCYPKMVNKHFFKAWMEIGFAKIEQVVWFYNSKLNTFTRKIPK